jgi:hypothetical protein
VPDPRERLVRSESHGDLRSALQAFEEFVDRPIDSLELIRTKGGDHHPESVTHCLARHPRTDLLEEKRAFLGRLLVVAFLGRRRSRPRTVRPARRLWWLGWGKDGVGLDQRLSHTRVEELWTCKLHNLSLGHLQHVTRSGLR